MKKLILPLAVLVLLVGGYFAYTTYKSAPTDEPQNQTGRYMDINTYVRNNISDISPTKEQLGGNFYVTAVQSGNGVGLVSYEDGHNAYTAEFKYHITAEGQPIIDSFIVLQ